MNQGKHICKELKAIRRDIAKENGIELEIPECTYQGSCSGTCPRCEAEAKYLENELARRISKGMAASVAGIALTLASPAVAANIEKAPVAPILPECGMMLSSAAQAGTISWKSDIPDSSYMIRVKVIDKNTKEEMPLVKVAAYKDGEAIAEVKTGFDGFATIEHLPNEKFEVRVMDVGYQASVLEIQATKKEDEVKVVEIEMSATILGMPVIDVYNPVIDMGSSGIEQNIEIDGLKVKAQY